MEAARVLKLRGHEPVIYEKTDKLGGTFIAASAESYKERLRQLLSWYKRQIAELGIEVKFNTKVEDISTLKEDEVIIATESRGYIAGAVCSLSSVHAKKDKLNINMYNKYFKPNTSRNIIQTIQPSTS